MRYVVYSLDMWGHVPADCCASYGCTCIDEETGEHDDDRCDCHEDCNQQFCAGEIEVSEDASDSAILDALAVDGFLTELGRKVAEIDDYSDGPLDVNDNEGRRLFHLMPEEEDSLNILVGPYFIRQGLGRAWEVCRMSESGCTTHVIATGLTKREASRTCARLNRKEREK